MNPYVQTNLFNLKSLASKDLCVSNKIHSTTNDVFIAIILTTK